MSVTLSHVTVLFFSMHKSVIECPMSILSLKFKYFLSLIVYESSVSSR